MEHCKACETKPEYHLCMVCGLIGPEIAARREAARAASESHADGLTPFQHATTPGLSR